MAGWQVFAFTEPNGTPPLADVSAPINVGPTSQDKSGSGNAWITADGLGSRYGALLATVSGDVSVGTTTNLGTLNVGAAAGATASLCLNGACTTSLPGSGGSGILNAIHTYSTAGTYTYTPPSGISYVAVQVCGAGGAGGYGSQIYYAQYGNNSIDLPGSGGGAGGSAQKMILKSALPANVTVTVGAGGVRGNYTTNGSYTYEQSGGASSFGSFATANGGGGAIVGFSGPESAPGVGGTASGGDLNLNGAPGQGPNGIYQNGAGGSSACGGPGGIGAPISTSAYNFQGWTVAEAGAGNSGNIYVGPYLDPNSPGGATQPGGNGSAGGGGGGAVDTPGNGGDGIVIISEYK